MKLSVIIVNHNAKGLTLDCIVSVAKKTTTTYEIILIDNASSDNSAVEVKNLFAQVKIISNPTNLGFAAANNQGMEIAQGEYIILLNNDTILKNNALSMMTGFMDKHPDAGALTCKLYDADGITVQRNCRTFPTPIATLFGRASLLTKLFPNNPLSLNNLLSDWDYNSIRKVDWVSGAALMVKKSVIDKVGMLDNKTFYMYWEDTDWCKRIHDAGWNIYFIPEGEIIHFCGKGGTKLKSLKHNLNMLAHMHYSAYKYFRKHHNKARLHPMSLLTFFGMITLVLIKSIIEVAKHSFRQKS